MCRFSEAELYWVKTKILSTSELMQFEIGISTRRYFPPTGTAGFERCCVNGKSRVPAPPPRITASKLCFAAILVHRIFFDRRSESRIDVKRSHPQEFGPVRRGAESVCLSRTAVYFSAGCFLSDLDAHAGSNPRRSSLNHLARIIQILNATRSLDAQIGTNCAAHQ